MIQLFLYTLKWGIIMLIDIFVRLGSWNSHRSIIWPSISGGTSERTSRGSSTLGFVANSPRHGGRKLWLPTTSSSPIHATRRWKKPRPTLTLSNKNWSSPDLCLRPLIDWLIDWLIAEPFFCLIGIFASIFLRWKKFSKTSIIKWKRSQFSHEIFTVNINFVQKAKNFPSHASMIDRSIDWLIVEPFIFSIRVLVFIFFRLKKLFRNNNHRMNMKDRIFLGKNYDR